MLLSILFQQPSLLFLDTNRRPTRVYPPVSRTQVTPERNLCNHEKRLKKWVLFPQVIAKGCTRCMLNKFQPMFQSSEVPPNNFNCIEQEYLIKIIVIIISNTLYKPLGATFPKVYNQWQFLEAQLDGEATSKHLQRANNCIDIIYV